MNNKLIIKYIFCISLYFTYVNCNAQSTSNTVEVLGDELKAIKSDFIITVKEAMEAPETLQSGSFKVKCEQIHSSLQLLIGKLDEASDILNKRETDISSIQGLKESDKLELRQVIQDQRQPLEAIKKTTLSMKYDTQKLVEKEIDSVLNVYNSFFEIAGPVKAQEKVAEVLTPILNNYLPPKPKATPTPKPTPKQPQVGQREAPPPPHTTSTKLDGGSILSFSEARQRADTGEAYAEAVLSIYYAVGYKTGKDITKAAEYALRSAKQQHPLGVYRLASMVENGDGFERDPYGAKQLKAGTIDGLDSMVGDPYAMTALGVMLFRGEGGLPKNQKEAARLYKLAADMGYAPAQYNFAACLIAGQGVPKNRALGIRYWEKACDQQYSVALKGIPE